MENKPSAESIELQQLAEQLVETMQAKYPRLAGADIFVVLHGESGFTVAVSTIDSKEGIREVVEELLDSEPRKMYKH